MRRAKREGRDEARRQKRDKDEKREEKQKEDREQGAQTAPSSEAEQKSSTETAPAGPQPLSRTACEEAGRAWNESTNLSACHPSGSTGFPDKIAFRSGHAA